MPQEKERKFLVTDGAFRSLAVRSARLAQGYLNSDPLRTVRVRISQDKGFLTVKGPGKISRFEWEKEIPLEEARELLSLCEEGVVEKIRHYIPQGGRTWEVDEFLGDNEGLVLAEMEFENDGEEFEIPIWVGPEVTGDERYYNSSLSKKPFISWD